MRKILTPVYILIIIDVLFQRCANIASPTGGPKDTIPPILVASTPMNGTRNYKDKEFSLSFSELVQTNSIQQKLIITPLTENKYKAVAKKNTVTLKFEDDFKDSTTYNFNFSDGITDLTESNPAINLSLAFSTGAYIDSMSIEGKVVDLFTQEAASKYLVGLYPVSDSLNFLTDKPIYFTTTNDSGFYKLSYIKSSEYRLLTFKDENGNITLDPETEQHGFIKDTIHLDSAAIVEKNINTLLQNVKPITFINSRPTGPYIELKYSKTINNYSITPNHLKHNIAGEQKDIIRIYRDQNTIAGDSINIYATATDTLANQTIDTVKTAFIDSNKKPADFSYTYEIKDSYLMDSTEINILFNKPVYQVDTSKIYFAKDSMFLYPISPIFKWNHNHTKLNLNTVCRQEKIIDSLLFAQIKYEENDTTLTEEEKNITPEDRMKKISTLDISIDKGAFISIENDTTKAKKLSLPLAKTKEYGALTLSITTLYESFNVQLMNSKNEITHNSWNKRYVKFNDVIPDTYSIRVLIDNDKNGRWELGNLLLNTIPEDIYLHSEETAIRENWVLEIDLTF